MGGGMPGKPFERSGNAHELLAPSDPCRPVRGAAVPFERLLECDVELVGHQLGHLVGFCIRHFKHPTDVTDGRLRTEGAKRDDLRDVIGTVLVHDIVEDLPPAGPCRSPCRYPVGRPVRD